MASYHLSLKRGKRGKACEHSAYISRVGKYGRNLQEPDLVATEYGNMPEWALGNPLLFWKMADKHERANGTAYREFEIALPSELSLEQQRELVDEFIMKEVGNKPYQFSIHSPKAALGDVDQTHGHIMLSDRVPDEIVRPPEKYFSRHNSANPELGGCRKDSGGKAFATLKPELKRIRGDFAELQNKFLEKYGHPARVDSRSNLERGIDNKAERHLGSAAIKKMTAEDKAQIKDKRKNKK